MSKHVNHFVLPDFKGAYVILICGGTASGKTWVVHELRRRFGNHVVVVSQDSFYKTASAGANFDHPDSIESPLLVDCIRELKAGNDAEIPVYDFTSHSRTDDTVNLKAKPVVIVEGILVMCYPELEEMADLTVYVDADLDTRLLRRMDRDIQERGRTKEGVIRQWKETVKPMHKRFVEPCKGRANIIINNDADQILTEPTKIVQLQFMVAYINAYLAQLSETDSVSSE